MIKALKKHRLPITGSNVVGLTFEIRFHLMAGRTIRGRYAIITEIKINLANDTISKSPESDFQITRGFNSNKKVSF